VLCLLAGPLDPDLIDFADLKREMTAMIGALGPSDDIELPSWLFYLPTSNLDSQTRACVEDYSVKITPKKWGKSDHMGFRLDGPRFKAITVDEAQALRRRQDALCSESSIV
jgi:hypothetical protein